MGFHVEKNIMVPMRDGTRLATDVWKPDGVASGPVLVVRLPYSKDGYPAAEIDYITTPNIFTLLDAGYAIVYQDCRGTGMSEGHFVPLVHEADDGVDTLAWIREQEWCNGDLGSFGHSYLGMTQWATASRAPEGLRAIATSVTSADTYLAPWHSPGGALSWHALWAWTNMMLMFPTNDVNESEGGVGAAFGGALEMLNAMDEHLSHVPAADQPLYRDIWKWWNDIVEHSERDEYWAGVSALEHMHDVVTPALHIGGWFDLFAAETVRTYVRARNEAGSDEARHEQQLIIGPWDHNYMIGEYHDRAFGTMSSAYAADLTQAQLDFFDRHVRGRRDGEERSRVRLFVMGVNEWREEEDWPLPQTAYTDYFLGATDRANSAQGGGVLLASAGDPGEEHWAYDPLDPVPSAGGRVMAQAAANKVGPVDQQTIEARKDVLVFSTEPLEEAVQVIGDISAVLHVSSDAVDTDVTVKLVDVAPDGRATYLTDGILRLRYRHSLAEPVFLTPGDVEEVTVEVGPTANVFLPGHRIRIEVSSSNFPRYDRNMNTAERPATATSCVTAHNVLHHGAGRVSRVVLPVIPNS